MYDLKTHAFIALTDRRQYKLADLCQHDSDSCLVAVELALEIRGNPPVEGAFRGERQRALSI